MSKEKEVNPTIPNAVFKVGDKKYKFKLPIFIAPGYNSNKAITATEALKDPKLLADLVKIGSGVIEEVEEEKKGGKE